MKLKIKKYLALLILTITILNSNAQEKSTLLKGIVKYDSIFLQDINVINKATKLGTSSNKSGEFTIHAKIGDSILFSSLVYQNRIIKISETHLKSKFITVYLEVGFNELDEVILEKKIIINWGDLSVPKATIFDNDKITNRKPPNARKFTDPNAQAGGVNFISIFKLLTKKIRLKRKKKKNEDRELQKRKEEFQFKIKQQYGDKFFTEWLKIPSYKINLFLDFCEVNGLSNQFLFSSEFEIKNFLVKQSVEFNLINKK